VDSPCTKSCSRLMPRCKRTKRRTTTGIDGDQL
jgi:hypothetical protein